jgi:hypothetical protein
VEGNRHNSVSCVESFFHSITVVNIDVNVKNSLQKHPVRVRGVNSREKIPRDFFTSISSPSLPAR